MLSGSAAPTEAVARVAHVFAYTLRSGAAPACRQSRRHHQKRHIRASSSDTLAAPYQAPHGHISSRNWLCWKVVSRQARCEQSYYLLGDTGVEIRAIYTQLLRGDHDTCKRCVENIPRSDLVLRLVENSYYISTPES